MTQGKMIVLEGPDGSGKSTQAKLLAEALRAENVAITPVREPGGNTNRLGNTTSTPSPGNQTLTFGLARTIS